MTTHNQPANATISSATQLAVGTRVRVRDREDHAFDKYGTVIGHTGGSNSVYGLRTGESASPHDLELIGGGIVYYDRAALEDVTPLVTFESEDLRQGAPEPQWELGQPAYHRAEERSFVVRTAHYAPFKGWIYGLSNIGEQNICTRAFESVLYPYSEAPGLSLTRKQLESWAGRRLSDDDMKRLGKCIPNSTVPDAVGEIVAAWDDQGDVDDHVASRLHGLRGCMVDGYDPDDVNSVLGRISDASRLLIVCVWDIYDDCGFGGNSQFYVEQRGRLHELAGNLWSWLNGSPGDPETPATPGTLASWVGAPTEMKMAHFQYDDGFHNYAVRDVS